jgi:ABC-type polysaccharide/polyol phosphate export permease
MLSELKELWRFRELLFTMVQRDLKIRYKNSALGFFWSLLNPLLTVLVMTFVFQNFMNVKVSNYSAYLLSAYLPFIFFQNCLLDSAQTILVAMPLIKKIYFPRELLPLAAVISNFVNFMLSMLVFFCYMLAIYLFFPGADGQRIWPFQWGTLFLPVLFLVSFCLATGLSFIVSAFNTFYEDVRYILGVVLYLLFFLCPIVYFSELVGNNELNHKTHGLVFKLYHLNPVAELSVAYRKLLLAPVDVPTGVDPATGKALFIPALPLDWRYVVLAGLVSLAVLLIGYNTFNKLKWRFVERP